MSDVGDVNRAHTGPPKDELSLYVHAAEKMLSPTASSTDRLAFLTFHKAANVAKLGELIAELRVENAALLEMLYGDDHG